MLLVATQYPLKIACYGLIDVNYVLLVKGFRLCYSLYTASRQFM
ncbi:unnamed protein product [Phyllotreta striolata]|uniref:Uncharacterized protein n=1 Tax=Phyllotreta striolata TaxID=444603 RepID=A0A9N9XPZ3_PHYSR|nr:unnamed protein product [Phyllotreta striolata]